MIPTDSGAFNCKYVMQNPLAEENKATLIPIERAEGRFLFVASEDDLNWDSKAYMENMVERLQRHGKDNFESASRSCGGGEATSHAAAEVHLWRKIQEFLRTHLSCDAPQTKARL
ncbi:hypothetical protein KUCAC02_018104 [Chaenocephalus aceratus]|uniref:Uncharacterized protein n=1 Tax=Chaenocephalus aceratus TaxID=36190 RepID=A0ACB9W8C1_CHAAC|nr:hypothetical protein KUCAC02_018104 [Chaenocephalus aceratus]